MTAGWRRVLVAGALLAAMPVPAGAAAFELYVRSNGGYEYLDIVAIDYSNLLAVDSKDPIPIPDGFPSIDDYLKEYRGSGFAVGGTVGILVFDFLSVDVDFRQAKLDFGEADDDMTDLTQLALAAGLHFRGTEVVVDPSVVLGAGYCYLTTSIPGVAPVDVQDRTANGFIGRLGVSLDVRFVSWMSAGVAADFSFLYFDAGEDRQAWGFNLDALGRVSIHI